ncbi:MAG: recombinase family protein [Planctomycetota bacterium]|nr:MAG: recombinase family protein [Planctomycetota bacterium]
MRPCFSVTRSASSAESNNMWWKKQKKAPGGKKAITYYRHSAQDRQENSIPIQRERIGKFADDNRIEIIKEFEEPGKSGLSTKGRDAFLEMIEYVIEGKEDFDYVLVLDATRWGRFQNPDIAAYYAAMCLNYGKQVVYTTMGFREEDDLLGFLHLNIERFMAGNYSRELSVKVFKGCVKIAEQGFRAGAPPPYGLHRLLLDEKRNPVQILKPGQRKSIQNQRVTLAPGDRKETSVVRKIFNSFVKKRCAPKEIAASLNDGSILSPGGKKWTSSAIQAILTNEFYIGTMVYNKTRQKLQSGTKQNPREEWVRQENAFKGIINKALFTQAQERIEAMNAEHERRYSAEDMLARLAKLYKRYGKAGPRQVAADKKMVSPATYTKHFLSLDMAFQNIYKDVRDRARQSVVDQLRTLARQVEEIDDYVVLNDSFSLLIQPSVPVFHGYTTYWSFLPDSRKEVDITLGVPLSNSGKHDILGYLTFPRMLVDSRNIKLFSSSDSRLELYGCRNLDMIAALLD